MSLEVIVPCETKKLDKQVKVLKWQIDHDTNEKDKDIHMKALNELIAKRKAII